MSITNKQIASGLLALRALADAIKELGEVPSGTLYSQVMGEMDLSSFNKAIELIVNTGLVTKRGDTLIWHG